MTKADATQMVLIGLLGILFGAWLIWRKGTAERRARSDQRSARFLVTRTSTMFFPKFDPHVRKGSTIYLPAGDGLYVTRVKASRARRVRTMFREWVANRRATVHLIVTVPNDDARKEWHKLKAECGENFHLYFLHEDRVAGPNAEKVRSQIKALHTFHPVLLVNPSENEVRNGAMWIEAYHAIRSKFAYHVEFVGAADVSHDPRFGQYEEMYKALLKGAHVEYFDTSGANYETLAKAA